MVAAKEMHVEQGSELAVQSLTRVAELPIVAAVYDGMAGLYGRVKNSPLPLVGRTLEVAEATAKSAAACAYPIALKFEKPITYVDGLALKGLTTLEVNVPMVKKAPQEIYNDAKAYVTDKVQGPVTNVTTVANRFKSFGVAKVETAKDYSRDKIIQAANTATGKWALTGMDACLDKVDVIVDKYIPGAEDEMEDEGVEGDEIENWDPALAPFNRFSALTNKVVRRVYKLTLLKAQAAQKKCTDVYDQMPTAGFVDYVRLQLTSGSAALADKTAGFWKEATPGRAAQVVTSGMNMIEARTAYAVSRLFNLLKGNYKAEMSVELVTEKVLDSDEEIDSE